MSSLYSSLHSAFGLDQTVGETNNTVRIQLFYAISLSLCHTIPVLLHEMFLVTIVYLGLFEDRLIQPKRSLDWDLVRQCIKSSLLNHLALMPLFIYYIGFPLFGSSSGLDPSLVPEWKEFLFQILVCVVVEDFMFYWSHRLLHHPALYKHFHKKHHEFKVLTGCSMASEYTHPLESLLGNILPVMTGPYLLKCHHFTTCAWLVLRMFKTCDAHSGYDFKWSPFGLFYPLNPAIRHDFHHETALGSYGSFFLLWDNLTGSDQDYILHSEKRKTQSRSKQI